jgi:hypothetical protein
MMQSHRESPELLAHFDRPKTVDLPDFEWDESTILSEPPGQPSDWFESLSETQVSSSDVPQVRRRGTLWVLAWAAAFAAIAVTACVLMEFAYVAGAEHALFVAARAGATEATLPRATYESVTAAIERRLVSQPLLHDQLSLIFAQNGDLVQQSYFRQRGGDRFAVTLSAPSRAALPDWLRALSFWREDSRISAHAQQKLPGRKLPLPRRNQTAAE